MIEDKHIKRFIHAKNRNIHNYRKEKRNELFQREKLIVNVTIFAIIIQTNL